MPYVDFLEMFGEKEEWKPFVSNIESYFFKLMQIEDLFCLHVDTKKIQSGGYNSKPALSSVDDTTSVSKSASFPKGDIKSKSAIPGSIHHDVTPSKSTDGSSPFKVVDDLGAPPTKQPMIDTFVLKVFATLFCRGSSLEKA